MSVKSVNFQSMQIHSMKRSERGKEPKKEPEKIWKYSTLFSKLFISKNPWSFIVKKRLGGDLTKQPFPAGLKNGETQLHLANFLPSFWFFF